MEQSSPLLSLPTELRCEIYKNTLSFSQTLRLQDSLTQQSVSPSLSARLNAAKARSTCIYRKQVWFSDQTCTSVLFTCRTIYNEAIELFYSSNRFHFPALLGGLSPSLNQLPSADLIQHASIDFSYTVTYLWNIGVAPHVDPTLAACIQQLLNACPTLKSLTLHMPSIPALVHLIGLSRAAESATLHVLRSLKIKLDRFTIIGRGDYTAFTAMDPAPPYAPMGLCTMIAPRGEWSAEAFKRWPHVTMREIDFTEENCFKIPRVLSVAEGFVTSTTRAVWGFEWRRERVRVEDGERVEGEDGMAGGMRWGQVPGGLEYWGWSMG